MKFRSGHVSNSSSSSFIIALGKIVDFTAFRKFVGKFSSDIRDSIELTDLEDIESGKTYEAELDENKDYIRMSRMDNDISLSVEEYWKRDASNDPVETAVKHLSGAGDKDIFIWNYSGGDPATDDGDYYDVSLDFFGKEAEEFYSGLTEENGVALVEKTYGGGFDG